MVLEGVISGLGVNELMAIGQPEDLVPYLEIYYFRAAGPEETAIEYTDAALTPPDGLVPYRSGYTLGTIRTEWEQWPAEDRQAFIEFLADPSFSEYLYSLFTYVARYKRTLCDHGLSAARTRRRDTGSHPLPPGNKHDT